MEIRKIYGHPQISWYGGPATSSCHVTSLQFLELVANPLHESSDLAVITDSVVPSSELPMIYLWIITGWWLGHPSEKYESQLG